MIYRCILPEWAREAYPDRRRVVDGELSADEVTALNEQCYNIYYLPNAPSLYDPSKPVAGDQVDDFRYVFVDMDLKDGVYPTKEAFLQELAAFEPLPTQVIDSGNGIHAYWALTDLDAMSFLRLQRRLMRRFKTDEAVGQIYQLMRVAGTVNTKRPDDLRLSEEIIRLAGCTYSAETMDKALPKITPEDEAYCQQHYNRTYHIDQPEAKLTGKLPLKFARLLRANPEVKELWAAPQEDRSKADYRLGHLLFANDFTKEEALEVLAATEKASSRAPVHRISYAQNIIDKVWTFELEPTPASLTLSQTVREILDKGGTDLRGARFPCWSYLDATHHGFRLGQVVGLVAGSGVGKTAIALNMFEGFVQANPDYDHFFVPLEQPAREIAERWRTMCADRPHLFDKVHIISNYDANDGYRNLSFEEIKQYLLDFQKVTGRKVGCVVIDHIGALRKGGHKQGECQDLVDICHQMKAFAIQTNTLLVMQSQAPREKAGIGDLELDKDAAYGTVFFESYCDFLITIWQPVKRCYNVEGCPTVTAYKFCKIRHKKKNEDVIQEDTRYYAFFDPDTERLRELTQDEEKSFDYFVKQCTNMRKADRKTDLIAYTSVPWTKEVKEDGTNPGDSPDAGAAGRPGEGTK